ncbi:MAG: hypothetical protein IJP17_07565 [Clostridia bacterium]|nr:hypothetical protein [Clostridia bacterium]
MKYRTENRLELFEFHDSDISLVGFEDDELVVSAKHLNIHADAEQNPSEHDLEIDCAKITFRGFRALSFEPAVPWEVGAGGNPHPVGAPIVYRDSEALDKIKDALRNQITIFDFDRKDGSCYFLDGSKNGHFFTMTFCFDSVLVEWDEYKSKAWYELHRQYKYSFTLATPDGDEEVEVFVHCHDEEVYCNGTLLQAPSVTVSLEYAGSEFRGEGKDYLWADAFADLQRRLPDGVMLKCCLGCKHGNMCPVGNNPGELFCTKDVAITQKSDLFFYTEDCDERDSRSRQYCDACVDYEAQCDEYFTYNDFLYYLKQS